MEPIWRTPTRGQAIEMLEWSRARLMPFIDQLSDAQLRGKTSHVGGGEWSFKDLLGHLASWEENALRFAKGTPRRHAAAMTTDEWNAAEIERKRNWSAKRVREQFDGIRAELIDLIGSMDDARWSEKVQTASGRSALGLVLGKALVGGRHGLFAHDLAHLRDVERSVKAMNA